MALSASAGRGARAEKVGRIFERFDANGDGGLDRDEMAAHALVVAVNPLVKFSEEQIPAILDEVFRVGESEEAKKALKEAFKMTQRVEVYDAFSHLKTLQNKKPKPPKGKK